MSWSEDAETMAAQCSEAFGQSILYSDPSMTEPATIVCPVGHERIERKQGQMGTESVAVRDVFVVNDEQELRLDGTFTIEGQRYAIDSLSPRIGGRTQAVCRRVSAVEKSRPRYRG